MLATDTGLMRIILVNPDRVQTSLLQQELQVLLQQKLSQVNKIISYRGRNITQQRQHICTKCVEKMCTTVINTGLGCKTINTTLTGWTSLHNTAINSWMLSLALQPSLASVLTFTVSKGNELGTLGTRGKP